MKKSIRKVGIFGTAALFLCSAVLGVSALSAGSVVADDSAPSMATVIGEKTSNVTVTAATQKGDYTGLLVSPSKLSDEWSAEIDTLFTGNAKITYLLPNRADLSTQLQGDYKKQANGFSVKNSDGEIVATYIILTEEWSAIGGGTAYMHNAVNDTYWVPYHHWDGTASLDYYAEPNAVNELFPNADGRSMSYIGSINGSKYPLSASYVAPKAGALNEAEYSLDSGTLEGSVIFEYADGKLTVKTTTYDVTGRDTKLSTATGNGQTLTVGPAVEVDLSEGYTVVMHNAPDFGKAGDMNYYEHTHSSAVLLTSVNGFDTLAPEVTVTATEKVISYDGESVVDEKNVISVLAGEKLEPFTYMSSSTVTNPKGNSIKLLGKQTAVEFDYADNKEFTADEEITVTYNDYSKAYSVKVGMPSVKVTDLFTATNTTVTPNSTMGIYQGVKVAKGLSRSVTTNGTFFGSSNISYTIAQNNIAPNTGHAWTLVDANWKDILTVVNYSNAWQMDSGRAYLFDPAGNDGVGKYTVATVAGVKEVTTFSEATSSIGTLPNFITTNGQVNWDGTAWNVETNVATLYFEYDEDAKAVTVKINTLQRTTTVTESTRVPTNSEKIVTLGTVSADLSNGYKLKSQNAFDLEAGNIESKFVTASNGTTTLNDMLITAINGVALVGNEISATSYTKKIGTTNEQAEDGTVMIEVGEEIDLYSDSSIYVGSLELKNSDTSVDYVINGELSNFGAEATANSRVVLAKTTFVYNEGNKTTHEKWNKRVEERNSVVDDLAKKYGFIIDDLYSVSVQIPTSLRANDGTHFQADGYAVLAQSVVESIEKVL